MSTILVVANQTLGGAALTARLEERSREGPVDFYVVVPATPPKEHLFWTEGEARAIATARLEQCLARLREAGLQADGEVGDANPMLAISDALRHREVEAVIVATLPAGVSRWLKLSLPERVARRVDVPVDHVIDVPVDHAPVDHVGVTPADA
jgi:GABA permease